MSIVTIYSSATSRILRVVRCPDTMDGIQAQAGEGSVVGDSDPDTQYVSAGSIVARPGTGATWSGTTVAVSVAATLGPLPVGTVITCTARPENVAALANETLAGTVFAFSADTPGSYTLRVVPPFPYKEETHVITVT